MDHFLLQTVKLPVRFGDVRCLMWLMYVNMGFQWI